jgi:GT2 family glycosyltransferase
VSSHRFPSVSVVIPSWNLKEDLVDCLDSLGTSSFERVETIVVDNGSTDGTSDAVATRYGGSVEVIRCQQNLGFGRAANRGIQRALSRGTDYVLVLNNDTLVHPEMVEHLVSALEQSPRAGIAGPAIYHSGDRQRIWATGQRRWLGPIITHRIRVASPGLAPVRVDYVTGCAMLVKRDVFSTIGMFDSSYRMYFEDADFCQRATAAGFEIWFAPQAQMLHKVSQSTRRFVPRRVYDQSRGRVIFLNRHTRRAMKVLANLYIHVRIAFLVGRMLLQGDTASASAAVRGTRAGYREIEAVRHTTQVDAACTDCATSQHEDQS